MKKKEETAPGTEEIESGVSGWLKQKMEKLEAAKSYPFSYTDRPAPITDFFHSMGVTEIEHPPNVSYGNSYVDEIQLIKDQLAQQRKEIDQLKLRLEALSDLPE